MSITPCPTRSKPQWPSSHRSNHPKRILIAATNIARAVGQGLLTDKQARNMNASLRMARWAIEQRAKAASEENQPDAITNLPEPMEKVLITAHTELEVVEGAPSLPSVGKGGMLNDDQCHSPARECLGTGQAKSPSSPIGAAYFDADFNASDVPTRPPQLLRDYPTNTPLDDTLLPYIRWVIRCYGPQHPEYDEAHRLMAAYIASGASSQ